jgi:hypothetical protein
MQRSSLLFCFFAGLLACTPSSLARSPQEKTVLDVRAAQPELAAAILSFASAADNRDAAPLETLLDEQFRVLFCVKGSEAVNAISKSQYLSLLQAGKLGGVPRQVAFLSASVDGSLARVSAVLTSPSARFESEYTLVLRGGQWRLVQDATLFFPAK